MATLIDRITLYRGEQATIRIEVNTEELTDKNLTGASILLRVGDVRAMSTALEVVGTVVDGPAGIIEATITPAQTAALALKTHDLQFIVVDGVSVPQVVAYGELEMRYTLQAP